MGVQLVIRSILKFCRFEFILILLITAALPRNRLDPLVLSPKDSFTILTLQEKFTEGPLSVQSGMKAITCAMQRPDSGLEVRDRNWLKITIHQAFIGQCVSQKVIVK